MNEGESVSFSVADAFASASAPTYEVASPEGTGFQINPQTGAISGTPSAVDLALDQPMPLQVVQTDSDGKETSMKLYVMVRRKGKF